MYEKTEYVKYLFQRDASFRDAIIHLSITMFDVALPSVLSVVLHSVQLYHKQRQ